MGKTKAISHLRVAAPVARAQAGLSHLKWRRPSVTVVLTVAFLAACDPGPPAAVPSTTSSGTSVSPVSESPKPVFSPEVVSCVGLDVQFNRNFSTKLDRERGLLEFSYKAPRYRHHGFIIRYRDDPSCPRNPDTRSLIQSAGAGREIAGCLDLPEMPPDGMMRVELWFGDATDRPAAAPSLLVHRDIPATDAMAAAALSAWIQGPTEKEKVAGAYASVPDGTELLGVDVDEGTAVVDLNQAFEHTGVGTTYEGAILEQLAGTITQFETVDRGLLKIDGEFKQYYMGHGFIVDKEHPLTRPGKRSYRVARTC